MVAPTELDEEECGGLCTLETEVAGGLGLTAVSLVSHWG